MFDKIKKLKEAFTKNSQQDSKSTVTPKTDANKNKQQRFGSMTQEQMKRIGDSGVSLLSQSKLGEDAIKSLKESQNVVEKKDDTTELNSVLDDNSGNNISYSNDFVSDNIESESNSSLESTEFSDISNETMESLNLQIPSNNESPDNSNEKFENNTIIESAIKLIDNSKQTLFVHSQINDKYPLDPETNIFTQTIATNYSQGAVEDCILQLRNFLNQNKGEVNSKCWYMLMDIYQVINDKVNFEKTALAFAQLFDTSPPSWNETKTHDKKIMMAGKNILTLDTTFTMEHVAKFKDFFKASKQEKFCKINVSQCRFEQSDIETLKEFYKLLVQLRKARIKSFLMGESNLLSFAKTYMNFEHNQKGLKSQFMENESFFWNLYLEILQWKGKEEEFEDFALQFADKFEISPNGWEPEGVMSIDLSEDEDNGKPQLDSVLNNNNINTLQEIISHDFLRMNKAEVDFTLVDRVDFSTCGTISFMIKELKSKPENKGKEIFLIRPNEMILTLFDILGTTDNFKVIPRKR